MKINEPLAIKYEEHIKELGVEIIPREKQDVMPVGSTDQGNVCYVVPSIHTLYDIKPPKGSSNHTTGFTGAAKTEIAHEATLTASKGIALTAIDFLIDKKFAKQVKDFFDGGLD